MTNNHKLGIFKDIPKNVTGEARRARAALVGRSPLLSERLRRNSPQFKVVKREKNLENESTSRTAKVVSGSAGRPFSLDPRADIPRAAAWAEC